MAKLCLIFWKISQRSLYLTSSFTDFILGLLLVIESVRNFLQYQTIDSLVIIAPTLIFLLMTTLHISQFYRDKSFVTQIHKYFFLFKVVFLIMVLTFVVSDGIAQLSLSLYCTKLSLIMIEMMWTLQMFVHVNNQLIKKDIQSKSSVVKIRNEGVELPN